MLKLPLELATHPNWRTSLTEAIARLRQLETEAEIERQQTGEEIKPVVMLIQAERRAQNQTFTPELVKKHLIEDFSIPAETIAIATGALDELSGKKLSDSDYPQFIITVDKLREGWDCPFAYVLFSFRSTTSATAVEQVLGRVLRMPHVTRKQREALNRSYAYVVSDKLAEVVQGLRDGLVQNGFERLDTKNLIYTPEDDTSLGSLFAPQGDITIPLPELNEKLMVPDENELQALSATLRNKLELSPETGTLTIKGGATSQQVQQIAQTFKSPEASKQVRERLDAAMTTQVAPTERDKTPAEKGETARVPLLCHHQYSFFDIFDETPLLDADWEITDFDYRLTESEFARDLEGMRRASLNISQLEKIECDIYDRIDSQLALFGKEQGWQVTHLVSWLDRNLSFPYAERDQKVAWLNSAVSHLLDDRSFDLEELAYRKFRLRGALQRKMAAGLVKAKQLVFDGLFADENRFATRDEHAIVLEQGRYAYDFPYTGLLPLKRHFFPVVGNLKNIGEEFECAEFIANQLDGVDWWVRNVEKKPTSFWLQTASDRFYPDFLLKMTNGPLVAVEYKGKDRSADAGYKDSIEKKRIGELWARRSDGHCYFAWVEDRNWQAIVEAIQQAE
jgi:type III restriction enzyme